jgi:hypothetical protein
MHIFRPVHPSELAAGYYTARRTRHALWCLVYQFALCLRAESPARACRVAWWCAQEQVRSFAIHLVAFCRRDLRAHLAFMRKPVAVYGERTVTFNWTLVERTFTDPPAGTVPPDVLRAWAARVDAHIAQQIYGLNPR